MCFFIEKRSKKNNMKISFILVLIVFISAELATAESECEKQKAKEAKSTSPLKLDVQCLPNGDYAPLQCFPGNKFCYCALKDGTQITSPSKLKKFCACDMAKHQVDKSLNINGRPIEPTSGTWVPGCEKSGAFTKKQCEAGTDICWCVNSEEGKQISKDKKKEITCN